MLVCIHLLLLSRLDGDFGSFASGGRWVAASPRTPVFSDFQSCGCGPCLMLACIHLLLLRRLDGGISAVLRRVGGGLPIVHGPQCFRILKLCLMLYSVLLSLA